MATALAVPASPAMAASCQPAAGADGSPPYSSVQTEQSEPTWDREVDSSRLDPYAPDAHDVVISGGGWGHGVGMSQYGAQGAAAVHGCSFAQILATYFPNTSLATRDGRSDLRLKLWTQGEDGVTTVWADERTMWRRCDENGSNCENIVAQDADTTVTVRMTADGFRLVQNGPDGFTKNVPDRVKSQLRLAHDGKLVRVLQGQGNAKGDGRPITFGRLEIDWTTLSGGRLFTTEVIRGGGASGLPAMETYLLGLAEVPFGWHPEALKAQVVAARSYAEARISLRRDNYTDEQRIATFDCRCDLVVTTGDQVWAGATKELAEPAYYPRWKDAVIGTAGGYVVRGDDVVTTFYSSSHGGVSRAGFTSSEASGYRSVDASRWEKDSGNRRYRWSQGFSRQQLQSAFGMDDVDAIEVVATDSAGYPLSQGVEVRGVDDGKAVAWRYSPDEVRTRLGLYSPRFALKTIRDLADDERIPTSRLAGDSRAGTAIRLSSDGWSNGSDVVVLARQDDPADALSGSALAGTHDAPLLLTPGDTIPVGVEAELERLAPSRVFLLGGTAALSEQIERDLTAMGVQTITRLEGETRFGTAVDVASKVARGGQKTAYLVRLRDAQVPARGWADALSVSAVAARRAADGAGWPILGTEDRLPAETRKAIGELGITRVVPLGGSDTIPKRVLNELRGMGVDVAGRLAGSDRYATSREVTGTDSPTAQSLVIATGENFPDGLAAGPYAARTGGALLLVPTQLSASSSPWQSGQHPALINGYGWADPELVAVGGDVAISNQVIGKVSDLLEDARP